MIKQIVIGGAFVGMTGLATNMAMSGMDRESYLSRTHVVRAKPPPPTPEELAAAKRRRELNYRNSLRRSSGGNSSYGGRIK